MKYLRNKKTGNVLPHRIRKLTCILTITEETIIIANKILNTLQIAEV